MTGFQDHFSARSAGYAAFRPRYPAELFEWLAAVAPGRELAWDCATGNGQAAAGLAAWFARVIATDASEAQVRRAEPLPNVEYRVARGEASGLAAGSVDLITVAQALHWLDRPLFFAEAIRVARAAGILAVWSYRLATVSPAIDRLIHRFYSETVGPYWPADRALVEQGYRTITLPGAELSPPRFAMTAEWTFDHMVGYLRTWSAVGRYRDATGTDPVTPFAAELAVEWGSASSPRRVTWPLAVRATRLDGETGPFAAA